MNGSLYKLLLLLLTVMLSGCSETLRLQPLTDDAVILAFGDSLTYGSGVNKAFSYPSVLQRQLNIKVVNAGVPGEVTADGLQRLRRLLPEIKPDLVILCHGGNDILRRKGQRQAKDNLRLMVEAIRAQGAEVVLVGVPEFGLSLSAAGFYAELAEELVLPAELDIVPDLERSPADKSDAIHFNQAGYEKMAQALIALLVESRALESHFD